MENNDTLGSDIHHWIIYMYTFPNGKRYIGKTKRTLAARQGSNFSRYRRSRLLWNAIQKYGVDDIEQEILFEGEMTDEYAARLEQIAILSLKTNCSRFHDPDYGYNLTDGGDGVIGCTLTQERYHQLAEQMRANGKKRLGTHASEESRQKMREAKLGRSRGPLSEEAKRKISIANSRENMSEETRARRSESKKKRVCVERISTGERMEFDSLSDAVEYLSVSLPVVSRWCHNHRQPPEDLNVYYL